MGDLLSELEGLERLDAARLNAVGLTEHQSAITPLQNACHDTWELGQLRGRNDPRGAGADNEHVNLVRELLRPIQPNACGGKNSGICRDVSVVVELHCFSFNNASGWCPAHKVFYS